MLYLFDGTCHYDPFIFGGFFYTDCFKIGKIHYSIIFYLFTMAAHSFFWPVSEIYQGVVWLTLFLACADYFQFNLRSKKLLIIALGLIPIIIFLYPLMIFTLGFSMMYMYKNANYRNYINFVLAYTSIILALKLFVFASSYDNNSMIRVFNWYYFLNVVSLISTQNFIGQMFANYYVWLCGFIIILIMNFALKKSFENLMLITATLLLILIVNLCFIYGGEAFYLEGQYMQISFFLAFIVSHTYWDKIAQYFKLLLISLVFVLFCGRIYSLSNQYTARIECFRELIKKYGQRKAIIPENYELVKKLKMTLSSAYEIWLLSTIENNKTASILITNSPENQLKKGSSPKVFIGELSSNKYIYLNPKYFKFSDTTTVYCLSQLM